MHRSPSDPPVESVPRTALSRLLDRLFPGRGVHRRSVSGAVVADESGVERTERARAILKSAVGSPATAEHRHELAAMAVELEEQGEPALAAEAFARAGDVAGQARALARAGDVEQLQALLEGDEARARDATRRRGMQQEFETRIANGRRRDAATLARSAPDGPLRERGRALEAGRVAGPVLRVVLRGGPLVLVLGERVVVGRAPGDDDGDNGAIAVPSPLLSRRHLVVSRRAGAVVVRDLGTHNGTRASGAPLHGERLVGSGLDLLLGGEVLVVVRPTDALPDAVAIGVDGTTYIAALGPAHLGIGRWRLASPGAARTAEAPWVELVTDDDPPAFCGPWRLDPRITLLPGDVFSAERSAPPILAIEAR